MKTMEAWDYGGSQESCKNHRKSNKEFCSLITNCTIKIGIDKFVYKCINVDLKRLYYKVINLIFY